MSKKGKVRYVPPSVWDEVEDIKREENLVFNSEALRSMVKHSRLGREMERISKFDWSKSKKRLPVNILDGLNGKFKPKKNKKGLIFNG